MAPPPAAHSHRRRAPQWHGPTIMEHRRFIPHAMNRSSTDHGSPAIGNRTIVQAGNASYGCGCACIDKKDDDHRGGHRSGFVGVVHDAGRARPRAGAEMAGEAVRRPHRASHFRYDHPGEGPRHRRRVVHSAGGRVPDQGNAYHGEARWRCHRERHRARADRRTERPSGVPVPAWFRHRQIVRGLRRCRRRDGFRGHHHAGSRQASRQLHHAQPRLRLQRTRLCEILGDPSVLAGRGREQNRTVRRIRRHMDRDRAHHGAS